MFIHHIGVAGPHIEYLQECLFWWDRHLKDRDNNPQDLPKFRIFLQDSIPPNPSNDFICPGKWLIEPSWPPVDPTRYQSFIPEAGTNILHPVHEAPRMDESNVSVRYTSASGQWAGEWLSLGETNGPADQQMQDGISTCWTTKPLETNLQILGFPVLKTRAMVSSDRACLAIRLCDVFPDGRSTLITYGIFNLTHHKGNDDGLQERLIQGREYPVSIELHAAGYVVPKGHHLRLGVSNSYWPTMWPSPDIGDVNLVLGQAQMPKSGVSVFHTRLVLPVAQECPEWLNVDDGSFVPKKSPMIGPELPSTRNVTVPSKYELSTGFSFSEGLYTRKVHSDTGLVDLKEGGLEVSYRILVKEVYTIRELDPLSACVVIEHDVTFQWPSGPHNEEPVMAVVSTHSEMTGNEQHFTLDNQILVKLNGQKEYGKQWKDTVPREFV